MRACRRYMLTASKLELHHSIATKGSQYGPQTPATKRVLSELLETEYRRNMTSVIATVVPRTCPVLRTRNDDRWTPLCSLSLFSIGMVIPPFLSSCFDCSETLMWLAITNKRVPRYNKTGQICTRVECSAWACTHRVGVHG